MVATIAFLGNCELFSAVTASSGSIETSKTLPYSRTGDHSTLRITDKDKFDVGTSCETAIDMLDQVRCADARTGGEVGIRYHRGLQSVTALSKPVSDSIPG